MAKIKSDKFFGIVAKMGKRMVVTIPAYILGFRPGDKVEVKKVK